MNKLIILLALLFISCSQSVERSTFMLENVEVRNVSCRTFGSPSQECCHMMVYRIDNKYEMMQAWGGRVPEGDFRWLRVASTLYPAGSKQDRSEHHADCSASYEPK